VLVGGTTGGQVYCVGDGNIVYTLSNDICLCAR
jgi:hypothetical protein